jgi:hypothetical protein
MITDQDARRIALSLPGAQEKSHVGRPDFRINNRIFATLRRSQHYTVVKLSVADQSALVAMNPETFAVNSWSHPGWTNVSMKHITRREFRKVIQAAWRNVAPKKLIASVPSNGRRIAANELLHATASRNAAREQWRWRDSTGIEQHRGAECEERC